jgi:ATP-dependent Clp protease adaptor protein ClpS
MMATRNPFRIRRFEATPAAEPGSRPMPAIRPTPAIPRGQPSPVSAQPVATPETGAADETKRERLYNVVLLDDDDHTYEYVVEMLGAIFFMSTEVAFKHAVEVDTRGRTVVITCERSEAEFARDQIQRYGADPRMPKSKGSMRALVEPVYAGPG